MAKHETFERRGDDLHMNAKVARCGASAHFEKPGDFLVHWEITDDIFCFLDLDIWMIFVDI